MASKKKKTQTAIVPTVVTAPETESTALAPMSSVDLLTAGIADFKLTKDDLIDLLVDEATRAFEVEIEAARLACVAADAANKTADEAYTTARQEHLCKPMESQIKALRKLFPCDKVRVDTRTNKTSCVYLTFLGPLLSEEESSRMDYDMLDPGEREKRLVIASMRLHIVGAPLEDTQEIKNLRAERERTHKAAREAQEKFATLQQQANELRYSSKKLRTQLIRNVLASNTNGAGILANVKGLSAQFVASLRKQNQSA